MAKRIIYCLVPENIVPTSSSKVKSLHTNVVAYQAGAYPGFCSMKRLGVFLLPQDGMLVHHKVTPSIKFAGTYS